MKMYEYIDFVTGERKRTRGQFIGWTSPMGPLMVRYAEFSNRCSHMAVPEYSIPPETMARIGRPPKQESEA